MLKVQQVRMVESLALNFRLFQTGRRSIGESVAVATLFQSEKTLAARLRWLIQVTVEMVELLDNPVQKLRTSTVEMIK
ncbi:hypothetical protein AKJ37_04050 [candidate division MSBL1 archaeon SCGC-AAA259I09]|uniref:Uncharacterized protein n=1 Tax=candidate division MSBL1 archaeon SCGC-AAA259I09 TaxID=1698267 RepID=A0A133URV1_9EURY|nr:hypothetical protein AKJ37_04050 [candidate division MSBL1 archaeon SCGC-AAA259I09]